MWRVWEYGRKAMIKIMLKKYLTNNIFGAEGVYDVGELEKRRLGGELSLLVVVELLPDVDVWDSSDIKGTLRWSGCF